MWQRWHRAACRRISCSSARRHLSLSVAANKATWRRGNDINGGGINGVA